MVNRIVRSRLRTDKTGWSPTTLKVRSPQFKFWLSIEYWKRYGKTASSAALGSVINLCEAMAISSEAKNEPSQSCRLA